MANVAVLAPRLRRMPLGVALAIAAAMAAGANSAASEPTGLSGVQLRVIPSALIATPRYPAQYSVVAIDPRGDAVELSRCADLQARLLAPEAGQLDAGVIRHRSSASTELEIQWRGLTARATLQTQDDPPLAYDREITAVLTRSGCNLGTCHGNLHGKGGMRLSLRGDDPLFDHYRLTREFAQRRIDLWEPTNSLIVRKPTGQLSHQGGKRFDLDSTEHQWLCQWIESGAEATHASPLISLDVLPREQRMLPGEQSARLVVLARYADGSIRDVTRWSRIEPSVATGIEIANDGWIHADRPIDASFSATYLSGRASGRIVFPGTASNHTTRTAGSVDPVDPVDALIEAQCRALHVEPAPRADDWTLVRRLYLVTLGRLPSPEETLAFVSASNPDKVSRTVDRLLADPAFDYAWAMRWSDLIRNEDKVMSPKGAALVHDWLRQQMAEDRSMSSWIAQLVSSVGSTYEHPPASYHRTHRDPFTAAESAAQVFLGVRVQCAKCHNHPFDVWKQDDYYGLAAFFTTIERKQIDNKPKDELDKHIITGDEVISLADRPPEMMHPGRSQNVPPRPLSFGSPSQRIALEPSQTILDQFGNWLTRDNPQFDANLANRIWYQYFGRGIVDPPDDFRDSNPPSNPDLLRWLAAELRASNYSLKQVSRTLLCSQAFARQTGSDTTDPAQLSSIPYFAAYPLRRLSAEVMLDAISDACDAHPPLQASHAEGLAPIRRAMEMPGVPAKKGFLKTFGKPDRLLVCECERTAQLSLGQSLSLVNGREVRDRISQTDNRIGRLMQEGIPFDDKIRELFLASLARMPTQRELEAARGMLESNSDRPKSIEEVALALQQRSTSLQFRERRVLEDVLWALINSKEFSMLR